jgi:hypothetical protein
MDSFFSVSGARWIRGWLALVGCNFTAAVIRRQLDVGPVVRRVSAPGICIPFKDALNKYRFDDELLCAREISVDMVRCPGISGPRPGSSLFGRFTPPPAVFCDSQAG